MIIIPHLENSYNVVTITIKMGILVLLYTEYDNNNFSYQETTEIGLKPLR